MIWRWVRVACLVAAAAAIPAAVRLLAWPLASPASLAAVAVSADEAGRITRLSDTSSSLAALVAAAPFRRERQPAPEPYRLPVEPSVQGAAMAPPRTPKPQLVLTGIATGARRMAVLEGVPGHEAAYVVGPGDTIGGIRIRRISLDSVVVTGYDTTWTLGVRRPW